MSSVKLYLIDEHRLFREGLRALIVMEGRQFRVVGESATAEEALPDFLQLDPQVLVLGHREQKSALQEVKLLRQHYPLSSLLVLGSEGSNQVMEIIQAGAVGYLSKGAPFCDFVTAVETLGRGEPYIHPKLTSKVLERIRTLPIGPLKQGLNLNQRERQVLEQIALGRSTETIARQLHCSPSSVKARLRSLFEKFGVRDRTHLVAQASRQGLLDETTH